MRNVSVLASAIVLVLPAAMPARACDRLVTECLPPVVAFPAYTPEGIRVGTVETRIRSPLVLEHSPYTGQPITVVYNDPSRLPGSLDLRLEPVELPRTPHFHTKAVYPRGY